MDHHHGRRLNDFPGEDSRPKVLLVDDQPLNLMFAAAEIEDLCHPILAGNGEEALHLARAEQPGLILLGVRMPGMDGFEVCRRLKADPETAGITVIFLTALNDETDEELGLNLGAIDYISKPFSPPILRARVRNQLLGLRQRQQLERIAQIDALTGIANRRSFDGGLQDEWRRHLAAGQPLGLLMIDVDHFKQFNDRCGHPAGDQALQRVAAAIARHMQRQDDLAVRYGGEEFACILPRTDGPGALELGERLCEAVRALRIPHPASTAGQWVTISVGAFSCVPRAGMSTADLVVGADRHLYQAKAQGRDRVVAGF
ncbi:MAG: diguanylate cyclase [Acidovorax sp.]|uniref:diguanylate cyclase domain-containing protein n=1 Tax=Acidovorax sp. TaxID=1872122 RepID=UPI0039E4E899